MDPDVTRRIAKLQYAAARLPFTLLDEAVVARYWDRDAAIRAGFERWLGSLDLLAGRLLADDEISRRGQALIGQSRDPAQAGGNSMDAPVQPVHSGQVLPDPQAVDEAPGSDAAGQRDTPGAPAAGSGTVGVTFTLPADVLAGTVALCGEFNEWSADDVRLERGGDGSWRATVPLEPGRSYRYRYLLDGQRWENDRRADGYVPNPLGSTDSVVVVE
jgi:predicted transcriptional regulator